MVFCYSSKNWLWQLVKEHKKEKKKNFFWPKWIQTLNSKKEKLWRVICKVHFLKHSLHRVLQGSPHQSQQSGVCCGHTQPRTPLGLGPPRLSNRGHLPLAWGPPRSLCLQQPYDEALRGPWAWHWWARAPAPVPGMQERLTSVVLIKRCPGNQVEKGFQWSEIRHVKSCQ